MKKILTRLAGPVEALAVLIIAGIAIISLGIGIHLAHADPKPGLWQESMTQADGVTVRKIRDTTGGEFNVCYVASNRTSPESVAVAISCLPEKRP